ncbi:putative cyanate transporter [Serratia rubidaea]|uniref:Putative cyanate transporter n=1 Tax=Serratia rubidaea TaxID=61652 RepID=A0A4U9H899_SERRU|nr:putative cyanate transporter [Serratia rubidaea]
MVVNHSQPAAASGTRRWFHPLLWALVLIGLNMRPLLTSVGPLLPTLRQATGLSFGGAALLTALPVLMMGLMALAGGAINRLLSERASVLLSLLAIALGALWRELAPDSTQLLLSAVLGGLGIGVIQAVMPGIIKHHFSQAHGAGGRPVVGGADGRRRAGGGDHPVAEQRSRLAQRAGLVGAAGAGSVGGLAVGEPRAGAAGTGGRRTGGSPLRSPRAWLLGIYFGLINGGYASLIAWLPPYYMQLGWQPQASGALLALMTLGQVLGALALPALARGHDRRQLLWVALTLQLVGFIGLIGWPLQTPWLWGAAGRLRPRRGVSAVPGAGAGSPAAAGGGRAAGGLYAGHRLFTGGAPRRMSPACCVTTAAASCSTGSCIRCGAAADGADGALSSAQLPAGRRVIFLSLRLPIVTVLLPLGRTPHQDA